MLPKNPETLQQTSAKTAERKDSRPASQVASRGACGRGRASHHRARGGRGQAWLGLEKSTQTHKGAHAISKGFLLFQMIALYFKEVISRPGWGRTTPRRREEIVSRPSWISSGNRQGNGRQPGGGATKPPLPHLACKVDALT